MAVSSPDRRRNWLRGHRKVVSCPLFNSSSNVLCATKKDGNLGGFAPNLALASATDLLVLCIVQQIIGDYLAEARAALAAAAAAPLDGEGGEHSAATAALGLVEAVLEMSPRMEAALELRARSLLALRRYRAVADMLRDYIPSCTKPCSADDTSSSSSSSSSCSSASRTDLLSPARDRSDAASAASRFLCCFDISDLKHRVLAGFSKNTSADTQWRYLVLGQACFHLGLMEDAAALLQTGRRLASAAFRRESVCWSEDSFSPSNLTANAISAPASRRASKSGAAGSEAESVSQLLAHLRPDRCASFAERLELVDEHRDLEAVRDQARMCGAVAVPHAAEGLLRCIMSVVQDEEAAERQRAKDAAAATAAAAAAAAAAALAREQEETAAVPEKARISSVSVPSTNVQVQVTQAAAMPTAAMAAAAAMGSPVFQGVFCRDMAVVGTLLSRGGFDRPIPVKCEAMSC
ncbi:hypothetical protein OsI_27418 [Oryza sativa Indica Group]|uniref:Uncharacterized protein n=1 Tax=Oryza sativa subsp. indica TaxID=39946 RepID=A2YQ59_ORYSI|nr:hypothetical protein OsI_27418 [Oryza sativa Indica Group]